MTLVAGVDSSTQSLQGRRPRRRRPARWSGTGRAPHPDGTEVDPDALVGRACRRRSPTPAGSTTSQRSRVGGQQHGMVCLDERRRGRPPGAAVERHPLGRRRPPTSSPSSGRGGLGRRDRRWCRSPRSPSPSCAGCADHEPDNAAPGGRRLPAARLADLAAPRLRPGSSQPARPGPGRAHHRPLRRHRHRLLEPSAGEYDLELFKLAFGRDAREASRGCRAPGSRHLVLPRVLGPGDAAGAVHPGCFGSATQLPGQSGSSPAGPGHRILLGPGAGDNAAAALGLGADPVTWWCPSAPAARCSRWRPAPSPIPAARSRASRTPPANTCRWPSR